MPIIVKEKAGESQPVPPGTHLAICYRIADMGTEHDAMYDKDIQKIVISWELPHEVTTFDGVKKPMGISKTYSASLGAKSTLRKDLESWRGRAFTAEELAGFELKKILGRPCMLSVISTEGGKTKIGGVMAAPKGTPVTEPFNPVVEYSQADGRNNIYETLPDWMKERLAKCKEWTTALTIKPESEPAPVADGEDAEMPF
jgi:hypothetical protein